MRLFIGVKTGCDAHLAALQRALQRLGDGNFTAAENLHMTLKFLGEASPEGVGAIREAMKRVRPGAVSLCCEGLQVFGRDIVSVRVGGECDRLSALHRSLETALAPCGFEREPRAYTPHITLARRFRPFGDFDAAAVPAGRCEFTLDEIVLFESAREGGRLVYTPLFSHRLV